MNKTILLGRLTKDPDIRFLQATNTKVGLFTLAVNRKYVKPGEERQADFITIVTYSKLADFVEKYLKQGIQICVSGKIQTRNYEDSNGNKHYVTEVIAEEIDFADTLKNNNEDTGNIDKSNTSEDKNSIVENEELTNDDDLPF